MLEMMKIIVPILFVGLTLLPLIKVFRGKVSARSAKRRLFTHMALFFVAVIGMVVLAPKVFAADGDVVAPVRTMADGMGYLGAAIATGLSSLGAGIAVAAAAPAAIGAISENPENLGKSLIFIALGEGVAIYGLLISILILNKVV